MKCTILIAVFIVFTGTHALAQTNDSALMAELLSSIAKDQVTETTNFYPGSFPSFRRCAGIPHNRVADNNIFYTAISLFTLRNLLPYLPEPERRTAEQVIEKGQAAFPFYQDKQGLPYYQFWPRGKGILPHSYVMHGFGMASSGQDADDAVMCLMATGANDSSCMVLKNRMQSVSNLSQKKIRSTYKRYRDIPAYSTWLGSGMQPDFDLGVHCNLLYFVLEKKLPLTLHDSASIHLIASMLAHRDYIHTPIYISPYYCSRAILMYHLARLMGKFEIAELKPFTVQLMNDISDELNKTHEPMDKIILSTSLLRLGAATAPLSFSNLAEFENSRPDDFVFFQARAAFSYPSPFKQIMLHWSYLRYNFFCPVWNKVLLLEYLVEKQRHPVTATLP